VSFLSLVALVQILSLFWATLVFLSFTPPKTSELLCAYAILFFNLLLAYYVLTSFSLIYAAAKAQFLRSNDEPEFTSSASERSKPEPATEPSEETGADTPTDRSAYAADLEKEREAYKARDVDYERQVQERERLVRAEKERIAMKAY
jgi:hypothetical protein